MRSFHDMSVLSVSAFLLPARRSTLPQGSGRHMYFTRCLGAARVSQSAFLLAIRGQLNGLPASLVVCVLFLPPSVYTSFIRPLGYSWGFDFGRRIRRATTIAMPAA